MRALSQRYRKALVTGAGSGLGRAFAAMLQAEGVEVWGTGRLRGEADGGEELPWPMLRLDLADPASVGEFMRQHAELLDDLDLLINNAGAGVFRSFFEMHPAAIGEQLKVLWHGPVALCHRVLPGMLSRGHGCLVNVSSLAAEFPLPWFSLYSSAKAGLSGFSRGLALELHGTDVAVLDFQPGDYRTGFNRAASLPPEMDEEEQRLWERYERLLKGAPEPERAARDLRRALAVGKSGLVRSGDVFQAKLAPLLARCAPWSVVSRVLRLYYGIK